MDKSNQWVFVGLTCIFVSACTGREPTAVPASGDDENLASVTSPVVAGLEGFATRFWDCCKPTCAWADWTVGYKLPVDGEWKSFYSCDKNGIPFTK